MMITTSYASNLLRVCKLHIFILFALLSISAPVSLEQPVTKQQQLKQYAQYSDPELIKLIKCSDENAFTELYHRYWNKLFYIAGKKLGDLPEAENILQDLFMDIWNRRENLMIDSVSSYLAVALKYNVIRALKKRFLTTSLESETVVNSTLADHSTEELIDFQQLNQDYHKALSTLPEKCSLVFSLRNQGVSYKEIAENVGISPKTVEMHVSRALKMLRNSLGSLFLSFVIFICSH